MTRVRSLRLFAICLFLSCAGRVVSAPVDSDPPASPSPPPAFVELTFESVGARLPGHAYLAAGPGPHPTVIVLHGFPGNERNLDLAHVLRRGGFNTVFFHYRGAWGAEGQYSITGQSADVGAVLSYLREHADALRVDPDRLSLLGHSLGGYTALAAGRHEEVVCVSAMAPANPALYLVSGENGAMRLGAAIGDYADSLFMLTGFDGAVMFNDLAEAPAEMIDTRGFGRDLLGRSVLLIGGEQDEATPFQSVFQPIAARYGAVPALALRTEVFNDDHSFSGSRVALSALLLEWLGENCR